MRRRQAFARGAQPRPVSPQDERAELIAAYEAKFGAPPHRWCKTETIRRRIEDDDTR